MTISAYLRDTAALCVQAAQSGLDDAMARAIGAVTAALRAGKAVLICGNGGSMADAQHIAGELTARFKLKRPALPAIALGTNPAALTAWSNDHGYGGAFAREVEAYGVEGGVFIGLSTSGESANVVAAAAAAKDRGLTVIALTGLGDGGGGALGALADIALMAPSRDTPRVQEIHIAFYHYLCAEVERICARYASRSLMRS